MMMPGHEVFEREAVRLRANALSRRTFVEVVGSISKSGELRPPIEIPILPTRHAIILHRNGGFIWAWTTWQRHDVDKDDGR